MGRASFTRGTSVHSSCCIRNPTGMSGRRRCGGSRFTRQATGGSLVGPDKGPRSAGTGTGERTGARVGGWGGWMGGGGGGQGEDGCRAGQQQLDLATAGCTRGCALRREGEGEGKMGVGGRMWGGWGRGCERPRGSEGSRGQVKVFVRVCVHTWLCVSGVLVVCVCVSVRACACVRGWIFGGLGAARARVSPTSEGREANSPQGAVTAFTGSRGGARGHGRGGRTDLGRGRSLQHWVLHHHWGGVRLGHGLGHGHGLDVDGGGWSRHPLPARPHGRGRGRDGRVRGRR